MGERIELPQTPRGTAEEQMRQMYSYLYRVAETLNHNLSEIGSMDLTDEERVIMQAITAEEEGEQAAAYDWQGKESLKSLIIKTAAFVQSNLNEYRINLLGKYVADGKFGKYVRNTGLKVDVTPTGIQQDFTFEEVVQGLKNYTVNAKNYIFTGLLRTVQSIPVYGVAIGKDVVTFSEDGTETYNDGNKVAELTADELSFYQNGSKVASYKGNRISFLIGGTEVFYIESGKIHSNIDLELSSGKKLIINTTNFKVDSNGNVEIIGSIKAGSTFAGTMSANCITSGTIDASVITVTNLNASNITSGTMSANKISGGSIDATNVTITNLNASNINSGTLDASVVTVKNIDASNITSGTMSANKISGGSIDASNVTITNLNASNINTGTLDASVVTVTNLNASNITSGTMSASKINGGTLTLGGNNNANGTLVIQDAGGNQIGKWDKDGISASAGTFSGQLSAASGTFRGDLEAADGTFKASGADKKITAGNWNIDSTGIKHIEDSSSGKFHHDITVETDGFTLSQFIENLGGVLEYVFGGNKYYAISNAVGSYVDLGRTNNPWGNIYYVSLIQNSSREIKHDIQPMEDVGEKLDQLAPVTFVYDRDAKEKTRAGFIYEDTMPVMPEICTGDEGDKAINYVELIPMLVKEIQSLRQRVSDLERRMDNVHDSGNADE